MSLPGTVDAWLCEVRAEGIASAKLGDIKADKHFSGSTIPHKAFLQLRAIWLPAKESSTAPADLEAADFFNNTDRELATSCLDAHPLQLQNFFATVESSYPDRNVMDPFLPATPILGKARLGTPPKTDDLGMFGPAFTSWRRLKPFSRPQRSRGEMSHFTPKVMMGFDHALQENLLMQPVSRLDLNKTKLQPRQPETPTAGGNHLADDLIAEILGNMSLDKVVEDLDTPTKPTRGSRPAGTGQQRQHVSSSAAVHDTVPAKPANEKVDNVPLHETEDFDAPAVRLGRTEYEVQTSHFFVTYADTLLAHALSLSFSNCLSIVPEERQYGFGEAATLPVPKEETAAPSSSGAVRKKRQRSCLFVACPDGAAYVKPDHGSRKAFLHFELKPFRRDGSARALTICREETAEIAAILYQEYCSNGKTEKPDEYWLIVATVGARYLDYIKDMEAAAVASGDVDMDLSDFIQFQPYGPFRVGNSCHMKWVNTVVTASALSQMQDTTVGQGLKRRLEFDASTEAFLTLAGQFFIDRYSIDIPEMKQDSKTETQAPSLFVGIPRYSWDHSVQSYMWPRMRPASTGGITTSWAPRSWTPRGKPPPEEDRHLWEQSRLTNHMIGESIIFIVSGYIDIAIGTLF
ncbi:hypothetical protein CkaCkLH20_13027 [Colletotrichum karsti]|uniref:Uncharacterized protein n=1 Tax=Colletotrichum karsti TaxID=1095194 RepID=A0A9P6LCR7_9PEZI|nr:uncharacterized protein CkaCkLH20_13027 [Colletotrichum karsti]KAF9869489.1 hypothetical protein CkaCkLH20_13027 [Colletotrichum karsti]